MADPDALAALLRAISALAEKDRTYFGLEEIVPRFGPPAREENLRRMAGLFGGRLPDDYLGLLARIDGAENYDAPDMCLLSCDVLLSEPGLEELFVDGRAVSSPERSSSSPIRRPIRIRSPSASIPRTDALDGDRVSTPPTITGRSRTCTPCSGPARTELEERIARHEADRAGLLDD